MFHRSSLLLHQELVYRLIDGDEVRLKLIYQQIKLSNVNGVTLGNHCHQNVFPDLHLLDEVLVVHYCNLELAAGAQLLELIFEVREEYIDAAAQPRQEVLIDLRFELEIVTKPSVNFTVILELGEHDGLQIWHPTNKLRCLLLKVFGNHFCIIFFINIYKLK